MHSKTLARFRSSFAHKLENIQHTKHYQLSHSNTDTIAVLSYHSVISTFSRSRSLSHSIRHRRQVATVAALAHFHALARLANLDRTTQWRWLPTWRWLRRPQPMIFAIDANKPAIVQKTAPPRKPTNNNNNNNLLHHHTTHHPTPPLSLLPPQTTARYAIVASSRVTSRPPVPTRSDCVTQTLPHPLHHCLQPLQPPLPPPPTSATAVSRSVTERRPVRQRRSRGWRMEARRAVQWVVVRPVVLQERTRRHPLLLLPVVAAIFASRPTTSHPHVPTKTDNTPQPPLAHRHLPPHVDQP